MGEQCIRCGAKNTKFKFFNNKKQDQPRYQCLDCTSGIGKPYFFNPNPKRQHHKDGYAKLPKEETEELKNLQKVCDKCQAVNNVKFRGYNNGSINQPRYVCRGCNKLFSPLKKSKAVTVVETAEPSNQFQTQPATSEALHQQIIPSGQQQIPPGFQPPHLQTPVQHNTNYQTTTLPQQVALENQQPYLQTQYNIYYSNPIPSSQQEILTGNPLPHFPPSFQNNHTAIQQQQQFAPQFQQPQHQPLVPNNQYNQRNFQQQQIRTEIQQPHSTHPLFQNNLRHHTTIIQQQQIAPRNQQLHYQPRIPQTYCNPRTLVQQEVPTGIIQQRHPQPSYQIHINQSTYLIPSRNQQPPFQPASQSNDNHPEAHDSEELGICNEQDPPTTASLPAIWRSTASPPTHQSTVPLTEDMISEEYKNTEFIFEEVYFKEMLNSRDKFEDLTIRNTLNPRNP